MFLDNKTKQKRVEMSNIHLPSMGEMKGGETKVKRGLSPPPGFIHLQTVGHIPSICIQSPLCCHWELSNQDQDQRSSLSLIVYLRFLTIFSIKGTVNVFSSFFIHVVNCPTHKIKMSMHIFMLFSCLKYFLAFKKFLSQKFNRIATNSHFLILIFLQSYVESQILDTSCYKFCQMI